MPNVGIRELKNEASEIIRAVRETHAEYVVTHRGEPVAVILPVEFMPRKPTLPSPELLAELDALRAEITAKWKSGLSAVEQVEEQRR